MLRGIVTVLATLAALLVLAPAAPAASASTTTASTTTASTTTLRIRGLEYAVATTEGRFGGVAAGRVPGGWLATVEHDPLRKGAAVPITGGSFALRGAARTIGGTFVHGTVTPLAGSATCGNERFDVRGTLALRGGGRGAFAVVLTHLRVATRFGCQPYGAVVVGSLTVPTRVAGT